MSAQYLPLEFEQGATWQWGFTWYQAAVDAQGELILDADGQPTQGEVRQLHGCKAYMQVRRTMRSDAVVDASTDNGLITITPDAGEVSILLPASVTMEIAFEEGLYDIEVVFPTEYEGGTVRCFEGPVLCTLNVTR